MALTKVAASPFTQLFRRLGQQRAWCSEGSEPHKLDNIPDEHYLHEMGSVWHGCFPLFTGVLVYGITGVPRGYQAGEAEVRYANAVDPDVAV